MLNLTETILSQYANSPILRTILADWNDDIDPRVDLNNFYDRIWNVLTAEGYGLDVWGRVVGVNRTLFVTDSSNVFGFAEGPTGQPFGQAPFNSAGGSLYDLPDGVFRQLIMTKAFANISGCSAESLNRVLTELFGTSGTCFVVSWGDMTMAYYFLFYLSDVEYAILVQSGVMTHPSGVKVSVLQMEANTFGFYGSGLQPFGQGIFFHGTIPVLPTA